MSDEQVFVREDVRAFLQFLEAAGRPPLSEMSLEEARASMMATQHIAERDARDIPVIRDLSCPGPAGDIPLRLYDAVADRSEPCPVIMFYHGGGFVIGDIETHHRLCTQIAAELELPVVSVDYRLAPENPFPAAPDDCEAATRWVADSPSELNLQVSGLIPMGDSAGGNLAIVTTQSLIEEPAAVPVVMQVPIYPLADDISVTQSFADFGEGYLLTRDAMQFFTRCYAPAEGDRRNTPILADHAPTPPTIVATASLDPLRDSGRNYACALIQSGVDVIYLEMRGNIHGFVNLRKAMPSAHDDMQSIFAAMKLMLERHGQ